MVRVAGVAKLCAIHGVMLHGASVDALIGGRCGEWGVVIWEGMEGNAVLWMGRWWVEAVGRVVRECV